MALSLKAGRILGIPIYLHVTLLLILPLFAFTFAYSEATLLGFDLGYGRLEVDDAVKIALGTLMAVLLFLSILAHELAHSIVALRHGYTVSGITLYIFGGASQLEKVPEHAPKEARMAAVGPLTSLVIGLAFVPLYLVTKPLGDAVWMETLAVTFSAMAFYNLLLGGFNLIPAFPMDGGRVLRAALAERMGFLRATQYAADVGKAIALLMGIFGFFFNIWLILIAFFIYFGATEELEMTKVTEALRGVKVREVMTKEVSTVSPDLYLDELQGRILAERHMGYPVLENGIPVGMVTLEDLARVPESRKPLTQVKEVMSRDLNSVPPGMEAMEALQILSGKKIGRLVVVEEGKIVGIISRTDLVQAVNMMAQAKGALRV
jgi:Zn-dependent protease/predicted transcriptional regulator